MGINVDLVKLGKETKLDWYEDFEAYYIDYDEDEEGSIKLKNDELKVSTARKLSYLILDKLIGHRNFISNDSWYVEIKPFELKEEWKNIKIDPNDFIIFEDHSTEMEKILKEVLGMENFYDLAMWIKKHNLHIGGY